MTRRWTQVPDPDEILCDACIIIHKCDDSGAGDDQAGKDTSEWEFVIEDEDENGICTYVFWGNDE